MLERIETAYLAVMRVVVLVAATVALLICIVGASLAAPQLARQLGFSSDPDKVQPVDLATFIQEQKVASAGSANSGSETSAPASPLSADPIDTAAKIIADYCGDRAHEPVDRGALAQVLREKRGTIEADAQAEYSESLLALANDLKASKGAPLSLQRVSELLDWHAARFELHVLERKSKDLNRAAKGSAGMMMAAAGLVAFILVLFFFLFVKIERNLRLVRMIEVPAP